MKKVLSVILVLMLLLTVSVAVIGCTEKTVTVVSYYADELVFKEGDTYADSAIKITAVMSDGSERLMPVDNKDYTKIVFDDAMKALVDDKNKFKDISEVQIAYITVTFLDDAPVQVKVTVKPKG